MTEKINDPAARHPGDTGLTGDVWRQEEWRKQALRGAAPARVEGSPEADVPNPVPLNVPPNKPCPTPETCFHRAECAWPVFAASNDLPENEPTCRCHAEHSPTPPPSDDCGGTPGNPKWRCPSTDYPVANQWHEKERSCMDKPLCKPCPGCKDCNSMRREIPAPSDAGLIQGLRARCDGIGSYVDGVCQCVPHSAAARLRELERMNGILDKMHNASMKQTAAAIERAEAAEQRISELERKLENTWQRQDQLVQHAVKFWERHGAESKLRTSCFLCGKVGEPSTIHLELPNVYVCKSCIAAEQRALALEEVNAAQLRVNASILFAGETLEQRALAAEADNAALLQAYGRAIISMHQNNVGDVPVYSEKERIIGQRGERVKDHPGAHLIASLIAKDAKIKALVEALKKISELEEVNPSNPYDAEEIQISLNLAIVTAHEAIANAEKP